MTKDFKQDQKRAVQYLLALIDPQLEQVENISECVKIYGLIGLFENIDVFEISEETKDKLRTVKIVVETSKFESTAVESEFKEDFPNA